MFTETRASTSLPVGVCVIMSPGSDQVLTERAAVNVDKSFALLSVWGKVISLSFKVFWSVATFQSAILEDKFWPGDLGGQG